MSSAATISLSHKDSAVMHALFDPEASLQDSITIDRNLPEPYDDNTITMVREQERQALLLINEQKPTIWTINCAIQRLSQIIENYPMYASAWNNRAQATRMLFDLADAHSHSAKVRSIYSDLSTAARLAESSTSLDMVSPSSAKVLASAYTHRGYLLWRASRPDAEEGLLDAIQELSGLNKENLEELASRDFSSGGRYGNQLAQQLAVKTNPYAKLCGSIVKGAMQKEIEDFYAKSKVVSSSA